MAIISIVLSWFNISFFLFFNLFFLTFFCFFKDDGPKVKKLEKSVTIDEIRNIAAAIKHPSTGIRVKDRRDFLHTHKGTFMGCDAKVWMQNYLSKNEKSQAEAYLQTLMDERVFCSCSKKNKQFRADKELYTFCSLASPTIGRAASAALVTQNVSSPKPPMRQSNQL